MSKIHSSRANYESFATPAPVERGGHGSRDSLSAALALKAVSKSSYNTPMGVAASGPSGTLSGSLLPLNFVPGPTLKGHTILQAGEVGVYEITNYDAASDYVASYSAGTVVRVESLLFVNSVSSNEATLTINGRAVTINKGRSGLPDLQTLAFDDAQTFTSVLAKIAVPEIEYQTYKQGTGVATIDVYLSDYALVEGNSPWKQTSWDISTSPTFAIKTTLDYDGLSGPTVQGNFTALKQSLYITNLTPGSTYHVRARYMSEEGTLVQTASVVAAASLGARIAEGTLSLTAAKITASSASIQGSISPISILEGTGSYSGTLWQFSLSSTFESVFHTYFGPSPTLPAQPVGTGLTVYVRARNEAQTGEFGPWAEVAIVTPNADPSTISTPVVTGSATPVDNQNVRVDLVMSAYQLTSGNSLQAQMIVQVATDVAFTNTISIVTKVTNFTSHQISGLLYDTSYYIRVMYVSVDGDQSSWGTFLVQTPQAPLGVNTPVIQATPGSNLAGTSALVDLNIPEPVQSSGAATTFQVDWELSTTSNFSTTVAVSYSSPTSRLVWHVENLAFATVYYVRARYHASTNEVTPWVSASFTTPVMQVIIAKPTLTTPINTKDATYRYVTSTASGFVVTKGTDTLQTRQWQLSFQADFGLIVDERYVTNSETATMVTTAGSTNYWLRMRYIGASGAASAWSDAVTGQTMAADVPQFQPPTVAVQNISSNGATLVASPMVLLSGPPQTYMNTLVEYSLTNVFPGNVPQQGTVTATGSAVTIPTMGLSPNTTYYFRLAHRTTQGGMTAYATGSFKTLVAPQVATPTCAITNQGFGTAGANLLSLRLTSSAFALTSGTGSHYQSSWQIATNSNFTTVVASSMTNTVNKTLIDFNVAPNMSLGFVVYYARVRHINSDGTVSAWSATVSLSFTIPVTLQTPTLSATVIPDPNYSGANPPQLARVTISDPVVLTGNLGTYHLDFQLSSVANFSTALQDVRVPWVSGKPPQATYTFSPALTPGATYYIRARFGSDSPPVSFAWGTTSVFVQQASIAKPSITSILPYSNGPYWALYISGSNFSMGAGAGSMTASQWQISYNSGFTSLAVNATGNPSTFYLSGFLIPPATTVYIRIRYQGTGGVWSAWSDTHPFTTTSPESGGE